MKYLPNVLLVLGVCVGSLGASGFHTPYGTEAVREDYALPLFALGLVLLASGGALVRASRAQRTENRGEGRPTQPYRDGIAAILARVVELDDRKHELSGEDVRDRIGELMAAEYFDLTRRSDDLIALVGFSTYARVWEGVATAERLLARCWSMCSDGHATEGIAELPLARASLEHAAREAESL